MSSDYFIFLLVYYHSFLLYLYHPFDVLFYCYIRDVYNKKKKLSAVARKIEAGEEVKPVAPMNLDTASWIITKGEGMGQRHYTNFKTVGARDRLFNTPSWKSIMKHWDSNIIPEPIFVLDKNECVNGVRYNVREFINKHMLRFLEAQEKLGKAVA